MSFQNRNSVQCLSLLILLRIFRTAITFVFALPSSYFSATMASLNTPKHLIRFHRVLFMKHADWRISDGLRDPRSTRLHSLSSTGPVNEIGGGWAGRPPAMFHKGNIQIGSRILILQATGESNKRSKNDSNLFLVKIKCLASLFNRRVIPYLVGGLVNRQSSMGVLKCGQKPPNRRR